MLEEKQTSASSSSVWDLGNFSGPKEFPNVLKQRFTIRERREMPTARMHLHTHHIPSPPCPTQRRPITNVIQELTSTHRLLNIR